MVLIGLLYMRFIENLTDFPRHFIQVRQNEVLNIHSIRFQYQFSGINLSNSTINLSRLIKLGNFYT